MLNTYFEIKSNQNKMLWKTKPSAYLLALTATGLTYQAANQLNSDVFPYSLSATVHGVLRSFRAVSTIGLVVTDYKYSLFGLQEDSDDYGSKLSEVHLRSAKRILKLCEANKGFYVKAGQFVAAMRQVPHQYSSTLSSLQDQASPCHFKAIKKVLISNLGQDLSNIFLSFDEQPIAAASIAQVHHAVLKDHQEVAIKVQYPGLGNQMKIDMTTLSFLSKSIAWCFPDYRFDWLISEFSKAVSSELDFLQEGRNSERTARNFKYNDVVRVPDVFWELTTSQVLTMQFCSGCKVDDVEYLKEVGINPVKVAEALVEVFTEMIFVHGFVHGDLHPGNILVSQNGPKGFSLVLLDHGIYKQLDEGFRKDYCELWEAMVLLDSNKIHKLGERFGVGKYFRYFPIIFIGRTVDSKAVIGREMSSDEKRKLKLELKSLKMDDVSSFMESLPSDLLTILRADGLLRSVIRKLGAPQRIRLSAYAKHAIYRRYHKLDPQSDSILKAVAFKLNANLRCLQFELILELLSWMEKFKQILCTLYGKIVGAVRVVMPLPPNP